MDGLHRLEHAVPHSETADGAPSAGPADPSRTRPFTHTCMAPTLGPADTEPDPTPRIGHSVVVG